MEATKIISPYSQTSGGKANLESSFIVLPVYNVGMNVRRPGGTGVLESWRLSQLYMP